VTQKKFQFVSIDKNDNGVEQTADESNGSEVAQNKILEAVDSYALESKYGGSLEYEYDYKEYWETYAQSYPNMYLKLK
jgi:uncharacterized caspase-like protein